VSRVPETTTISLRIDSPLPPNGGASSRLWAQRVGLDQGAVDAGQQTNLPTPQRRPVRVRDTSNDADPALMRQLAALGSNLNQIARSLNECRLVGAPVRLVEVLALLRSIEAEAAHLLPQLPPPPNRPPRRAAAMHVKFLAHGTGSGARARPTCLGRTTTPERSGPG
jgi:hypothetical protein